MTKRICLLGDSHLGSIKNAWKHAATAWDAEFEFFPDRTHGGRHLRVLGASDQFVFDGIRILDGWNDTVEENRYTEFGIVGLGLSMWPILSVYRSYRTVEHRLPKPKWLVSNECFRLSCIGAMRDSSAFRLYLRLKKVTDKPVFLMPQPRWSEYLLHESASLQKGSHNEFIRSCVDAGDIEALDQLYAEILESLRVAGVRMIEQPSQTRSGSFTKGAFSLAHPPESTNNWFAASDFHHMSDEFGGLVVERILRKVHAVSLVGE